jgi:hypothetical protein
MRASITLAFRRRRQLSVHLYETQEDVTKDEGVDHARLRRRRQLSVHLYETQEIYPRMDRKHVNVK